MKQGVDDCHTQKWQSMPASMQEQYLQQFDALLQQGRKEHPIPQKQAGKRGSVKKSKSANLVDRFSRHKEDIVRVIKNFGIPFGNNLAEQAIRMMKVKQKISGCFRSKEGATLFANIRSYIVSVYTVKISFIFRSILKFLVSRGCCRWLHFTLSCLRQPK